MIISLAPGEVITDVLKNFKSSDIITVTFCSDWEWGHITQFNERVISHHVNGQRHIWTEHNPAPIINMANCALNGNMQIEIKRQ